MNRKHLNLAKTPRRVIEIILLIHKSLNNLLNNCNSQIKEKLIKHYLITRKCMST
jgi:hypothetical protein